MQNESKQKVLMNSNKISEVTSKQDWIQHIFLDSLEVFFSVLFGGIHRVFPFFPLVIHSLLHVIWYFLFIYYYRNSIILFMFYISDLSILSIGSSLESTGIWCIMKALWKGPRDDRRKCILKVDRLGMRFLCYAP